MALASRVMRLEDHTRRKNLRINGGAELSGETNVQTVLKEHDIVENKLALDDTVVLSTFRAVVLATVTLPSQEG